MQLKQFNEAIPDFTTALELGYKEKELAYYNLGICHFQLSENNKACEYWLQAGDQSLEYRSKYCP